METVEIYGLRWYQKESLKKIADRIFDSRPGFISRGDRVLIKPNMLAPTKPEKAVTTHPVVVWVVVEKVIELGGKPVIGDSPALSDAEKVGKVSGIKQVADELGVPLVDLGSPVEVKTNSFFRKLEVSRKIMEFDKVINLPKFKTHTQMILTLSVKNMFGSIPGKLKAEWHVRASKYMDFARMLYSVYSYRPPDLNIMDAVIAMDGEGPQNGKPFPFGFVMASENGLALDYVGAKMVKSERMVYLIKVAEEEKILPEKINIRGDFKAIPEVEGFTLPSTTPLSPSFARRILRGSLPKPKIIPDKCTACGICQEACPTDSILEVGKRPRINYETCISCFVCQEVCPFDSIKLVQGFLRRIFKP